MHELIQMLVTLGTWQTGSARRRPGEGEQSTANSTRWGGTVAEELNRLVRAWLAWSGRHRRPHLGAGPVAEVVEADSEGELEPASSGPHPLALRLESEGYPKQRAVSCIQSSNWISIFDRLGIPETIYSDEAGCGTSIWNTVYVSSIRIDERGVKFDFKCILK